MAHEKKSFFIVLLVISLGSSAQVSKLLDIPGRLQWDNNNGYCGENSILAIGMYYGNYVSEIVGRRLAGGELLIASNDATAFNALSFTYDEWDYTQATPQYQNYLVWVKQHLNNRQPVIITVYIKGMSDPDYDHIIPAIGFNAANVNSYTATDQLIYNSNYDSIPFTRTFASIFDTRTMTGNGATYNYCIPTNVDYGCAITGVKDVNHVLKPVHLKIDSWDEPNISLGQSPKVLHAVITVDSLLAGQQYALMRYNKYQSVPSTSFIPQSADTCTYFTASGTSQVFHTTFKSDTTVFYRCIQYTNTDVADDQQQQNSGFTIFPNPGKGEFKFKVENEKLQSEATELVVSDVLGKVVYREKNFSTSRAIDLSGIPNGIYFVKTTGDQFNCTKKLVIR